MLYWVSGAMLQISGDEAVGRLADLGRGEQGILVRLDLPEDEARRLMELGFIPGSPVTVGRSAPGGDPQVYRVDGSEIALRRETTVHLHVRRKAATLRDL